MRLVVIVAEWLYLQDRGYESIRFADQDSNTRDIYFRDAHNKIQRLMQGYIGNKSFIANVVRGSIQDFMNAHGYELTKDTAESLSKRILSNIRHLPRD